MSTKRRFEDCGTCESLGRCSIAAYGLGFARDWAWWAVDRLDFLLLCVCRSLELRNHDPGSSNFLEFNAPPFPKLLIRAEETLTPEFVSVYAKAISHPPQRSPL